MYPAEVGGISPRLSDGEVIPVPTKMSANRPARGKAREERERKTATRTAAGQEQKRKRRGLSGPYALSIEAAGAMVGLSKTSSYRAANSGKIPVIGTGRNRIVPRLVWEKMLGIKSTTKAVAHNPRGD